MRRRLAHINWGACGNWSRVHSDLKFLRVTLFANVCDAECNVSYFKRKLEKLGYKVTIEEEEGDEYIYIFLADK